VRRAALTGISATVVAAWLIGCISDGSDEPPLKHRKHSPVTKARGVINEEAAGFAGVRLGDPGVRVNEIFGRALRRPSGRNHDSYIGPLTMPCSIPPCGKELGYGDAALTVGGGEVVAIEVYGYQARTAAGVGIGDAIERVKAAYARDGIECRLKPYRRRVFEVSAVRANARTA
jgi:hypothetical protein